ncbi:hypothetical protein GCM10023144_16870 [Pigmentiphaga soli]|uniref:Integral membrane protein n=1 Tax=Pigmentiphaga soli TaxID=1007095 RepID=A0ABP8GTH1_9BURK
MKRRPLLPALGRRLRRPPAGLARLIRRPEQPAARRLPPPLQVLVLLSMLALGAALGSGLYEYARRLAGLAPAISHSELAQLRGEAQRLVADNERLQNRLNAADGQLAIERAAKDQLAAELRAAQKEMGGLRNDLAFFEQLIPADPRQGQVSIRSAEVDRQGASLRYRVLLMRSGRPSGEFRGQLQFTASGTRDGASVTVDLRPPAEPLAAAVATGPAGSGAPAGGAATAAAQGPAGGAADDPLGLRFRQYQRAEGTLDVPPGFVARTVTVRVLEGGVVRSQSVVDVPA